MKGRTPPHGGRSGAESGARPEGRGRDRDRDRDRSWKAPGEAEELAFALAHEVGNWLAAVRLQAHLLDEGLGPSDLARASLEIDELCDRASALLAQLRPLLSRPPGNPGRTDVGALLAAVRRALVDQGLRGVTLDLDVPPALPAVAADRQVLHPVLVTLVRGALDASRPGDRVKLGARVAGDRVVIDVEDGAHSEEEVVDWRGQPLRGRSLGFALADALARKLGGRLSVSALAPGTRVELELAAPPAGSATGGSV